MMVAWDGFLNCTGTVIDAPDARPSAAETVKYRVPKRSPAAFASVTPVGIPVNSICNGPPIWLLVIFVKVTVPLNV